MEEWRDIKDYEGLYKVSNMGRIKSLSRFVMCHDKEGNPLWKSPVRERIRKIFLNKKGYPSVVLSKNGVLKTLAVHRLVANQFISKIYGKNDVNHISFIKTDNRVKNLEWVTKRENNIHSLVNRKNKKHGKYKMNMDVAMEIRRIYKNSNVTHKYLSEKYLMCERNIGLILRMKIWR